MKKIEEYHSNTQKSAYLFLMPSLIILTIFVFIPLVASFVISLLNINIFMNDISFGGFVNFNKLFSDSRVFNATINSFYFTLLEVPLQIGLALLLAMYVARNSRYTKILRSVYYLPFVCSMTAISIIWSMMLDPNLGFIPYLLKGIGLHTISFLKDPKLAMPTVIAVTAWKGFGYTLTLLTAAILNIPSSLYEAAEIDGAGTWKKYVNITIPSIFSTISFCIVTTTIGSLQVFDQTYVMTQGGPLRKTETLVQYIYDRGFQTAPYDLGYASAISMYLFTIIVIIIFVLRKFVLNRGKLAMNKKINIGQIIGAIVTAFIAILVLGPFLWLLVSSFKTDAGVISYPPKFFPNEWTLKQYKYVSKSIPVFTMLKNTIIFAGSVTVISVFFDSLAGYAFARMRFKGRKVLFSIILMTMMIPFQIIMTPLYIEEYKMGLLDSYAGLILPRATSAFGIYMLCSFFEGLPKSLEESGRMDGMNEFRIYWSLMLPLCKPALVSLGIFHFMNNWNDLLYPLMLTSSAANRTLSAGLAILVGNKVIKYGPTLAATMISLTPLLILYVFCQKYFVEGIATTGVKE